MGSHYLPKMNFPAWALFLAPVFALIISLSLFFSLSQRYFEFTVTIPGSAWVHVYPFQGGEAVSLKYKGVKIESAGKPVIVRIPLLPVRINTLLIRFDDPGGTVSLEKIRLTNGLGQLLGHFDAKRIETSASSFLQETDNRLYFVPTGLSRIIDLRLHLSGETGVVPDRAIPLLIGVFVVCLPLALLLLSGVTRLFRTLRQPLAGKSQQAPLWAASAAVFLMIFGFHLWLVKEYGSELPFWDQWDAEALTLYLPYLNGTLTIGNLFSPHNEHRIMLTRLAALVLLRVNGSWDPLLQMVLNAAVHAAAGAFLFRILAGAHRLLWGGSIALLFSLPFGWQNSLGGFQLQMYLMIGLSLPFLWFMTCCSEPRLRWAGATISATALLFTMASGFLACLALLPVVIRDAFHKERKSALRESIPPLLLISATAIAGLLLKADVPHHAVLRASSLHELFTSFAVNLGWPLSLLPMFYSQYPLAGYTLAALLLWLPFLLLLSRYIASSYSCDRTRLLVAAGCWIVLQAAAAAFARAANLYPSSRYLDIYALGMLVNIASLLFLYDRARNGYWRRIPFLALVWTLGVTGGLLFITDMTMKHDLPEKRTQQQAALEHVQQFLSSGDLNALSDKPKFDIPYPDRDHLARLLAKPELRSILPPSVGGSGSQGLLTPVRNMLLATGPLIAVLGVILFTLNLSCNRQRQIDCPAGEGDKDGTTSQ